MERLVIGKDRAIFGNFAELSVKALQEVSGVNDSANLRWVVKVGCESLPVFCPGTYNKVVFWAPFGRLKLDRLLPG